MSCFGATTANILSVVQGANPPQITAVIPSDRLVTLTVGGNDIYYVQDASTCARLFTQSGCHTHPSLSLVDEFESRLRLSLTQVVQAIRGRAPSAKLVIVTYPRIVSNPGDRCPRLSLNERDASMVDELGAMLERVTVSVAHAEHVLVADPYAVGKGHGPCAGTSERWVSGGVIQGGIAQGNIVFHPTNEGRAEMASLVERALRT